MQIKCPRCGSLFQINESDFDNPEVKFKCYKCGFVWLTNIDKLSSSTDMLNQSYVQNKQSSLQSSVLNQLQSEKSVPKVKKHNLPKSNTSNTNMHNVLSHYNPSSVLMKAFIVALIISIISILIVIKKDSIVRTLVGAHIISDNTKTVLEIEIEKPIKTITKQGKDFLIIKGSVINPTDDDASIPIVLIELKNKNKFVLSRIKKRINAKEIKGGQTIPFTYSIEKKSPYIDLIDVRFLLPTK